MKKLLLLLTHSLRNKIIFITCFSVLTTAAVIGGSNYISSTRVAFHRAIDALKSETFLASVQFKNANTEMKNDALLVSQTPPIMGIIRSLKHKGVDPLDGSTTELWRTRLATIFSSIMTTRPYYNQMRYIGVANNGRELVRVNRHGEALQTVRKSQLQEKHLESYFKKALTLKKGEIYFSDVTYNRERGQLDKRLIPTVRAVLPIYNSEQQLFGFIVINADYRTLLHSKLMETIANKDAYIVNHHGDYIKYNKDGTVGNLEIHDYYSAPEPEFIKDIKDIRKPQKLIQSEKNISYFIRLPIYENTAGRFLGVVLSIPIDEMLTQVHKSRDRNLVIAATLILLALMATLCVTRRITHPLKKMTKQVQGAGKNNYNMELPTHLQDEIGELARAFKDMSQKLVDSENKVRSVIDNVVDGIITINEKGVVDSFNPACEKLFGYEASEVIGKNIKMLMPPPYHDKHDSYLDKYKKTGKAKIIGIGRQVQGLRKDGTVFPLDLSVSEVMIGGKRYYSGIIRDISELTRQAKELKRSNEDLDNFAYIASHDLKAPLRVIDNSSRFLEEDLAEHLTEENKKDMELLRGRVSRMEKLLDDLLDYSRYGRMTDDRYAEIISGQELMDDILSLLAPPEHFTVTAKPELNDISIHRMPLQQVIYNLINNAIKHHDKDTGTITVSVKDENKHYYRFTVKDDGPGIAKEYQKKVFQMFQTLKPRDQVEGSGMGLAMVKKIIDSMNCTLTLTSDEGKGCSFSFTWPKQQGSI
jgi:PAS domain S-box-containing protein